jgi:dihydroorotate dehydrogenase (NAD+) catalytic subunit
VTLTPTRPTALEVELAGMRLAHPVLNGSGTYDAIAALRTFGDPLRDQFPFSAFVSKTITVAPRGGNPPPRLWETPAGLINSIGLPNKGLDGFLGRDLPELATLPVPLVVSVAGFSHAEFEALVEGVAGREEVAALELNVSCPNVKSGCVIGTERDEMSALMARVRPLTRKPMIVKLTPNVSDVVPVAQAAEDGGADALSLINTLRASAIDPRTGEPWLGAAQVAAATRIPIVGMGGVQSGRDALDFVQAGAACVAVGTESFRDPAAGTRVRDELDRELRVRGLQSVTDATRIARTRLRS